MDLTNLSHRVIALAGSGNAAVKVVAGLAAVAVADSARAGVIYYPASVNVDSTNTTAKVDFDQDGLSEFSISYNTFSPTTPYLKLQIDNNGLLTNGQYRSAADETPLALAAGTSIGPAADYGTGNGIFHYSYLNSPGTAPNGNFPTSVGEKFIGVEFTTPDTLTHYGYIAYQSTSDSTTSPSGQLLGFAYDSVANTPIAAGAVPEPFSLGLLALGAVGLARFRGNRKA